MSTTNSTLANLSTPDLLNLIDQLQEIGIGDEIKLPQIIVIGSQSSGKSSVLEAISRLSFPRGQGLTTTFATEIALRKSEEVSISARIISATETQRQTMPGAMSSPQLGTSSWTRTLTELNPNDIATLVNDAREVIEQNSARGPMSFSFDKLRIEASGPDFPLLTLIDLPGLILTPNDDQTKQDVEDVEKIVRSYMTNEESLMLAIITAETELVNQRALELAAEYDPKGSRTIGVITKPDLLPVGHPNIKYLVRCVQGEIEQRRLTLGWFVLKNRNFDMANLTAEERDDQERAFFQKGEWSNVGSHRTGVSQLRDTLSKLQEKAARAALPNVIEQLNSKLSHCEAQHEKLGPARVDERDQRFYLDKTASAFSIMVQQAVKGDYMDRGFFDGGDSSEPRQLRAVLDGLYRNFLADMTTNGRTWVLVRGDAEVLEARKSHSAGQKILTMEQMFNKIQNLHQARRGMSLEGMVDQYPLVASLFEEQSEKWEKIAQRHVGDIYDAILRHLYLVVDYLASRDTARKIQSELVWKPMAAKQKQVIDKVRELVAPYQTWRPLTMNPMYGQFVYKEQTDILQSVPLPASNDLRQKQAMEQYTLVLNHLEIYYLVTTAKQQLIGLRANLCLECYDHFHRQCHHPRGRDDVAQRSSRSIQFVHRVKARYTKAPLCSCRAIGGETDPRSPYQPS
jgi:hypothetical protein